MTASPNGLIPARHGSSALLREGQFIQVINTHGQQVVDTWAFNRHDMSEHMSMEHTRAGLRTLLPQVGDMLLTNRRRPILEIVEDTTPGLHDTLIAACDVHRYEGLGYVGYHHNCTDNLREELKRFGDGPATVPCPFNLFMNIPWTQEGILDFLPPTSKPGDYIKFQARMDCLVVFSACPQDLIPVNGVDQQPSDAHFMISDTQA